MPRRETRGGYRGEGSPPSPKSPPPIPSDAATSAKPPRKLLVLPLLLSLIVVAGCGQTVSSPRHGAPAATTHQSAMGSIAPPGWGAPAPASAHLFAVSPRETAVMFDTVTLAAIPRMPFALAGYTAGLWPTYLALRGAYPHAHTVSIAVSAADRAACLDVEPGDAVPGQAPGWVRAEKHAGWGRPCLYSDWWEFHNELTPALQHAGIRRDEVWEIDADYTERPHIDVGFDGTQWTDRALDRNLDESLVTRAFLSIAQPALRPQPSRSRMRRLIALWTAQRNATLHRYHAAHCLPSSTGPKCTAWRRREHQLLTDIRRLAA